MLAKAVAEGWRAPFLTGGTRSSLGLGASRGWKERAKLGSLCPGVSVGFTA